MADESTRTTGVAPKQCIASTDRHSQCKGKAWDGAEFCIRHGGQPRREYLPGQDGPR